MADPNDQAAARFEAELEMLQAIYPNDDGNDKTVTFNPSHRELRFTTTTTTTTTGTFTLRIPSSYPVSLSPPEILMASCTLANSTHKDLRTQTKSAFQALNLTLEGGGGGDEILDALLLSFQDVVESQQHQHRHQSAQDHATYSGGQPDSLLSSTSSTSPHHKPPPQRPYKTVVIWLHHLLNTNKRKLALHPSLYASVPNSTTSSDRSEANPTSITGITKSGYPGILLYSGPRDLVTAHVSELRAQRWQAFQIRHDSDDDDNDDHDFVGLWAFDHPAGTIVEVESIAAAVRSITNPHQREQFLAAVGVK